MVIVLNFFQDNFFSIRFGFGVLAHANEKEDIWILSEISRFNRRGWGHVNHRYVEEEAGFASLTERERERA